MSVISKLHLRPGLDLLAVAGVTAIILVCAADGGLGRRDFHVRISVLVRTDHGGHVEIRVIAEGEDQEPDKAINGRNYTVDEVLAGFHALDAVEKARLRAISKGLAKMVDWEPDELLNDALDRMLTRRTCSIDVSIMAFAIQTMKSITSTAYRKRKKSVAEQTGPVSIAANDVGAEIADDALSPEEEALAHIFYGECLDRVDAVIADDEELQLLVLGLGDGLLGQELEEFLGTDTKGLAAARKRLANRLRKAFRGGAPL